METAVTKTQTIVQKMYKGDIQTDMQTDMQ